MDYAIKAKDGSMQELRLHSVKVATLAERFAEPFGGGGDARAAGLLHDIGKKERKQQLAVQNPDKLLNSGYSATYSAKYASKMGQSCIVITAIQGMHNGLKDLTRVYMAIRNAKNVKELEEIEPVKPSHPATHISFKTPFSNFIYTHMIFSSLLDADCIVCDEFNREPKTSYDSIENIRHKFSVTENRKADSCSNGFTESNGYEAILEALSTGRERYIYLTDSKFLLEREKSLKNIFGKNMYCQRDSENREDTRMPGPNPIGNAWDAPIILSSYRTFFQGFFSPSTADNRRLHNIAGSCLIVEDITKIPISESYPYLSLLKELKTNYDVCCLFCTDEFESAQAYLSAARW